MPRPPRALLLALALAAAQLIAFAALDRRPPDDHDDFYTAATAQAVVELPETGLAGGVARHFAEGRLHPGFARASLLATLGTVGPSRAAFRLANLPWLLLLVAGTWFLGHLAAGRWAADASALAVATLPIVVQCSRKWDIQFHAAALTPWAWALALAALARGTRGSAPLWAGLAVVQALRLHTHPIVAPDVAALYGLLLLALAPSARQRGLPAGARLGHWLGSVLGCGFLSGWYLGVAPALFGEAPHSLRRYLAERGSYMGESWWSTATLADRFGLLVELASESAWLHAMPVVAALTVAGWALLARRRPEGADGVGLVMLAAGAAAQVPPILLGTSNLAFINDWLFVVPGLLVLAAAGWAAAPRRRLAAGLGAAQGAVVLAVPLVTSLLGPPALRAPAAYDGPLLGRFARGSSGRHHATHHLLIRTESPATTVAKRLAEGEGPARVALHDLTWDPTVEAGARCRLGAVEADPAWRWAPPEGQNVSGRPLSPWPFVFAGRDGLDLRRPDEDGTDGAEAAVVRLWIRPSKRWESEQDPCWPSERLPDGFLDEAERRVAERFGAAASVRLPDPAGWWVGRVVEWDRNWAYLGTALLVDVD